MFSIGSKNMRLILFSFHGVAICDTVPIVSHSLRWVSEGRGGIGGGLVEVNHVT